MKYLLRCFFVFIFSTCISPYGQSCYECHLSKGSNNGVPLVDVQATTAPPQLNRYLADQGYGYQYNFQGSGGRTRRRAHHAAKFKLRLPFNLTSAVPIVKLVPVLRTLNGTFEYVIAHGDTKVFKVDQYQGVTYLHVRKHLPRKGTFRLLLKGLLHHKLHKKISREEIGMREAKKFVVKLIINII